ncbi:unnamed protein product, partial [marine sediment metagenome]
TEIIDGGFLWISNQVEIIKDGLPVMVGGLAAPEHLIGLGNGIFGIEYIGILPFLVGGSMYIQQKMTSTGGAAAGKDGGSSQQTQKMMTIMMPLMIGFMSFSLPSGLTLYWFTSTLLGIGQQYLINKKTPTIVEVPKEVVPGKKEKSLHEKLEKPVPIKEEPWIPGYEGADGETPFGSKTKTKKYKKGKHPLIGLTLCSLYKAINSLFNLSLSFLYFSCTAFIKGWIFCISLIETICFCIKGYKINLIRIVSNIIATP